MLREKRLICSRRNVNMAVDVNFISMSRDGQLTGFCNAIAKFYLKAERTYLCDPKTKYSCAVLLTGMFHICILASKVDLICLARTSDFTGFCHALSKTRNTGIQEHRNTGTPKHSGTLRNTPEQPGTPEQPKNPGTPNLTMLF